MQNTESKILNVLLDEGYHNIQEITFFKYQAECFIEECETLVIEVLIYKTLLFFYSTDIKLLVSNYWSSTIAFYPFDTAF